MVSETLRAWRGLMIRLVLIAATLAVLALVWAAGPWAVSPPVNAGTPLSNQPPSVAVDPRAMRSSRGPILRGLRRWFSTRDRPGREGV